MSVISQVEAALARGDAHYETVTMTVDDARNLMDLDVPEAQQSKAFVDLMIALDEAQTPVFGEANLEAFIVIHITKG